MNYIVIHPSITVSLDKTILSQQGFKFIFNKDGSVFKFEELDLDFPYTLDTLPGNSIHVVYDGNGKFDDRTYKQYDAMEIFIKYHILISPLVKIAGINQIEENNKIGFSISNWLKEIGINNKNIYDAL